MSETSRSCSGWQSRSVNSKNLLQRSRRFDASSWGGRAIPRTTKPIMSEVGPSRQRNKTLVAAKSAGNAWPADRIERWAIKRLVPYARNARTHSAAQVDQIAASIREWGWTNPILVGEDGTII